MVSALGAPVHGDDGLRANGEGIFVKTGTPRPNRGLSLEIGSRPSRRCWIS